MENLQKQQWIYSPIVDSILVFSGISGCFVLTLFQPTQIQIPLTVILGLQLLSLTHSWSTIYMVVGSRFFQSARIENRTRYVKIPLFLFLSSLCLGLIIAKTVNFSENMNEITQQNFLYFFVYVGTYMVGQFWHFRKQDFIVLSLYRDRAGQFSRIDEEFDDKFTKVMTYVFQPLVFLFALPNSVFSILCGSLLPMQNQLDLIAKLAIIGSIFFYWIIVFVEIKKTNRSVPKLLYYTVILFHVLFLYRSHFSSANRYSILLYWQISYYISHWLIAITMISRLNITFLMRDGKNRNLCILKHFVIVGGGALLFIFILMPFSNVSILGEQSIQRVHNIFFDLGSDKYLFFGLYFGFALGEQLVHYYCDYCLFGRRTNDAVRNLL